MKIIKRNKKVYVPLHVQGYNKLRLILKSVFIENKNANDFMFIGCMNEEGRKGILVSGTGIHGLTKFDLFYPVEEIRNMFVDSRLR